MLPCEMDPGESSSGPVCAVAPSNEIDEARPAARKPAEQTSNSLLTCPPSRTTRPSPAQGRQRVSRSKDTSLPDHGSQESAGKKQRKTALPMGVPPPSLSTTHPYTGL